MRNNITASDDGTNSSLLDSGRFFESVGVDSTEERGFERHGVEGWAGGDVVGWSRGGLFGLVSGWLIVAAAIVVVFVAVSMVVA